MSLVLKMGIITGILVLAFFLLFLIVLVISAWRNEHVHTTASELLFIIFGGLEVLTFVGWISTGLFTLILAFRAVIKY